MVYNTQNYFVPGVRPSSGILDPVYGKFCFSSILEFRAMDKVQKHSNSDQLRCLKFLITSKMYTTKARPVKIRIFKNYFQSF
jgi:hypothetical protein